jgi:ribonuclease BN (tRNA processing enzyme)
MRIHVLGCWGAYPAPGEATTGYLVETAESKILLDCGSGVLAQLFKQWRIEDIHAAIITHHHHDHMADLGVLGYVVLLARVQERRKNPLLLYMPSGSADLTKELQAEPMIDLHTITEASVVNIGSIRITFTKTVHPVYCLAVRMEYRGKVFVFSADSSECQGLAHIARNADLFLCECSLYEGQEETAKQVGHLTAKQVGQLAKDVGVKKLALTHYPHYGDLEQLRSQAEAAFGRPVLPLLKPGTVLTV